MKSPKIKDRVIEWRWCATGSSVLITRFWAALDQWPSPGRCLVCVCSNDHAARCWTSVEWKNIPLCCLLPFDVAAGLAVSPTKMPKEVYDLYYVDRNCIVTPYLTIFTSRQDRNMRIWVAEGFSFWFTHILSNSPSTLSMSLQRAHCCSFLVLQHAIFHEPVCIPWTTSARTACKTLKQVCPSASPVRRLRVLCAHGTPSCSTRCLVGRHQLFLAVFFSGKGSIKTTQYSFVSFHVL